MSTAATAATAATATASTAHARYPVSPSTTAAKPSVTDFGGFADPIPDPCSGQSQPPQTASTHPSFSSSSSSSSSAPAAGSTRSSHAGIVAAALAATPAAPSNFASRKSGIENPAAKEVWCVKHFQYRWRCMEVGVAHECHAKDNDPNSLADSLLGQTGGLPPGVAGGATNAAGASARASGGAARMSKAAMRLQESGSAVLDDEELEDLEFQRLHAELEDERLELQSELRRAKQRADTVTPEMQSDIEQLLDACGIPYIHAPAEAEAQCAFLAQAELVDAVASDDSDTLVFGAKHVYRRLFSDDHTVECYDASRLQSRLGLIQADLIVLAMLLGCDYTLGVHGVGIVNGLEIVRAFLPGVIGEQRPSAGVDVDKWLEALKDLRAWASNVAGWDDESAGIKETDPDSLADFKKSHRNFRTQWSFPEDFPDASVHEAFAMPVVDRSLEPFSWSSVDLPRVVALVVSLAGLSSEKVLEKLEPAVARYTDTLRQPRITEWAVSNSDKAGQVAMIRSSRMGKALRGLRGEAEVDNEDDQSRRKGSRRGGGGRAVPKVPAATSDGVAVNAGGAEGAGGAMDEEASKKRKGKAAAKAAGASKKPRQRPPASSTAAASTSSTTPTPAPTWKLNSQSLSARTLLLELALLHFHASNFGVPFECSSNQRVLE
uniref:DNA repair protein XPG n=1 Tax=Crypthecodinium cohnii TaxID=2866 RepID=A0A516AGL7_CRYCO|nr:DNA repair protein XPG [Crypthecodinium cohnii]